MVVDFCEGLRESTELLEQFSCLIGRMGLPNEGCFARRAADGTRARGRVGQVVGALTVKIANPWDCEATQP